MERKNIFKRQNLLIFSYLLTLLLSSLFLFPFCSFAGDESLCAEVSIEILQGLTLERQAFDAHMRINNGLTHISLENVDVDVTFQDEDGNTVRASYDPSDTDALFFIRLDSMGNIADVDGAGIIQASSFADIHWLIIPAPGASNGLEQGALYYVGATLTYTIGGEEFVTQVTPDYIFVKPMPELILDYFLPTDVYGDDAFTPVVEPPIPFSLGVRAHNNGFGIARNLKIDSVKPKIIENEQGLLIGFIVESCEINGQPEIPSLRVDFGNIRPNTSGVARWIMTCSLSGQFVEFKAEYSHSNELGGELTSLLGAVNTHFLVHDVLVDLPGRDHIRDFLAKDGDVYTVYESESMDTSVEDQSEFSSLQPAGQFGTEVHYSLSTPVTAGFMYVQLPDPHNGQMLIKEVVRSDGKYIKPENVWLSKIRNEDYTWQHFISLFDVNTMDTYSVVFGDPDEVPHPPVLQFIPDQTRVEGEQLSFIIEASDPDGTVPILSAAPLPAGASFIDQENGVGIFDWTPAIGQAGKYEITFTALDGQLADTQSVLLTICPVTDTDCDGMVDDWEMEHFGTLDRDGAGDFDGDGIPDLDEYLNGTDPASSNVPTIPIIDSPEDGAEVDLLQPDLVIQNSTDPDGDTITYEFEVYSDPEMTDLVASQSDVPESMEKTSWTVPVALNDDTWYYWRVRAGDGTGFSQWAYGGFFVNLENNPPGEFHISSPEDGSEVDMRQPVLQVTNSIDVDGDMLTYTFEVSEHSSMDPLVALVYDIPEGEEGSTSWTVETVLDDNTWYYWKATVVDEHGAAAETPVASFFVNTSNDAPEVPAILAPAIGSEVETQELDLMVENALDLDGDELRYFFEIDKVNTFDSEDKKVSGEIAEDPDITSWHITGLDDNTLYYWRAKANDGTAESGWVQGSFFVNTENDNPSAPTLKNPGQGAWVETLTPKLEVHPSVDKDNDTLFYRFEVYSDESLTNLIAQGESENPECVVSLALDDNTWYYWLAQAEDEHGATSGWMDPASFFVNNNGVNDPPEITMLEPFENQLTNAESIMIRWEDSDPDSNADIALFYDTDAGGEDGTLIQEGLKEDPEGVDDAYLWNISGMGDGTYYVYGTIADEISYVTSYASGAITMDRTPPIVAASPPGGTYDSAQSVTLFANETSYIYYTMDGSDPTTDSPMFISPIEISESATIRFMAIDMAGNQSDILHEIYIIALAPLDTDGDGIPDEWELVYFETLDICGTGDFDKDGLWDQDEYLNDTDPTDHDTDDDGMPDGWEVDHELDPLVDDGSEDLDGDGFTNLVECLCGTNPNDIFSKPKPPVADAGNNQNVITGELVTLNGSESYDPEGATITFFWSFTAIPYVSSVTDASLSDIMSAKPTFTPDMDGTYKLQLIVHDGVLDSAPDEVEIVASTPNVAPNANAGPDKNVSTGSTVCLDGSGSNDPDNGPEPLSFIWHFDLIPFESLLNDDDIIDRNHVIACFIPDVFGDYQVRLTVSDWEFTSDDTAQITATTPNIPPNANAGEDMAISLGETATLDGSESNDPDNSPQPLSYSWRFVSLPPESGLTNEDITKADTVSAYFTPDAAGTYVLELMVGDGEDYAYDNVAVTVKAVTGIPGDIDGDGQVCKTDLDIILAARNTPADGPDDPLDLDGDGMITAYDARKLVILCTSARCVCQ